MKFVISQEEFSKSLTVGTKSILSKANLPILSAILINVYENKLEILSTDLDSATRVVVDCKVESEGRIALVGKNLLEFVSQLPAGDVVFEKLGEEVLVSTRGHKARFVTMEAEDFPAIPKIEKGFEVKIVPSLFVQTANKVVFSASQDEARPILTGILCDFSKNKVSMVATDGYRLSFCDASIEREGEPIGFKVIVPARAFDEASKIISEAGEGLKDDDFKILVEENLKQVSFKIEQSVGFKMSIEFTSRLIEGEFPNWQKIIPANFDSKIKINKEELVKLLRLASIFARDSGSIVKLKFENGEAKGGGKLSVSAVGSQVGSTDGEMDIEVSGRGGEIAFNFRYLLEALSVISEDDVYFEMIESLSPGKITSDNTNFFHIVMPVRQA